MRVDPSQNQTPFEVYCQRCRVSFPVGTRQCMHCGSRIGRTASRPAARTRAGAPPPPVIDEIGEEEVGGRSGMMSPVAILWIVLLLGGAVYRACS